MPRTFPRRSEGRYKSTAKYSIISASTGRVLSRARTAAMVSTRNSCRDWIPLLVYRRVAPFNGESQMNGASTIYRCVPTRQSACERRARIIGRTIVLAVFSYLLWDQGITASRCSRGIVIRAAGGGFHCDSRHPNRGQGTYRNAGSYGPAFAVKF